MGMAKRGGPARTTRRPLVKTAGWADPQVHKPKKY